MTKIRLTPHFLLSELTCHDGTPVPGRYRANALAICERAEVLRREVGPLFVTSGYRSPAWNRRVGGAKVDGLRQGATADRGRVHPGHVRAARGGFRLMLGFKPNHRIWKRVNKVILNENAAEVLVTLIGGISSLLVHAGVAATERAARVHLAAMLLSPDDGPVGSLAKELPAEFARLNDGKWRQ